MVAYRRKELAKIHIAASAPTPRATAESVPATTPSSQAHQNLHSGFQKLRGWSTLVTGSALSQQQTSPNNSNPSSSTEEIEARACDDVDREIHLYLSHPVIGTDISACDILAFWQVCVCRFSLHLLSLTCPSGIPQDLSNPLEGSL
jgi:hypothetical protein